MDFILPYKLTVLVLGLSGLLFWLQLIIADVVSIKLKHPPGFSVEQSHNSFLFRSSRVFANSNESVGILVLFALFGILSAANPTWLNNSALMYLVGRIGHMFFYYFDLKFLRSTAFGISFIALLGMFISGAYAWF
ncbi:MAPEG family protein [Paraglaciecola sp.]|uniref:MAPEG family protein n=1 Tax=Paraglaciecola sp. TaxID=1920173 RepID=UPI003EF96A4E